MIDEPRIVSSEEQLTAVIRFTIPRHEIQQVMGPAIGEVMGVVAAQGIGPAGPVFSYHLRKDPETFDFEVGVQVRSEVKPSGRVRPGARRRRICGSSTSPGPSPGPIRRGGGPS